MPPTPTGVLKRIDELQAAEIKDDAQWFNAWADYWRYVIGVNTIPCISQIKNFYKGLKYTDWQNAPLSEEQYQQWKAEGKYNQGFVVLAGKVWHRQDRKHLFLNLIDCDNRRAIEEVICASANGSQMTLERAAQLTVIEQHAGAPDKAHVYVYSTKPFPKKSSDRNGPLADKVDTNEIPALEVKGEGEHGVHFVCPSVHPDNTPYQIIGTREPVVMDGFDGHIDNVLKKYNIPYLSTVAEGSNKSQTPIEELFKEDFVIQKNHNRHEGLLRAMDSLISRNKTILPLEKIKQLSREWNEDHCSPPLDEKEFEKQWKCATKYIAREAKKREEEDEKWRNQIDEINQRNDRGREHSQDQEQQTSEPGAEEKEKMERIEEQLKPLFEQFRSLKIDRLFRSPEYMKKMFHIKTTRPDEEMFYYNKLRGVYLPDGEIVVKKKLEIIALQAAKLYEKIVPLLDELYDSDMKMIKKRLNAERVVTYQLTNAFLSEYLGHVERQSYFYRDHFDPNIEWIGFLDCMCNLKTADTAAFSHQFLNTTWGASKL